LGDPVNKKCDIKQNVGAGLVSAHAITLITLVITIVILIILAGITINLALKDNGLFNKTKEAKAENTKAEVKEQIETAILTSQIGGEDAGNIDTSILGTELINTYGIAETDITKNGTDGNLPWSVKKDGYQYTITKAGEVKSTKTVTVEEIIAKPKEYYGKEVANYAAGGYTYRIFYVEDEDNYFGDGANTVYLKADYVSTTIYPKTDIVKNPTEAADTKVFAMNPVWAKGATSDANTTIRKNATTWNNNEKQAAYLCSPVTSSTSTLPWASYYDENKASYVIGGASVEMFIKSYNQTHDKNADGKEALSCEYQYTSSPGYVYQVYGATESNGFWTWGGRVDYKNYNSMYSGRNGNGGMYESCYGYWLSSPSAFSNDVVCVVDCNDGAMGDSAYYNRHYSLAPLVSLKSDVIIEIYE
jgi:hypothetical protein